MARGIRLAGSISAVQKDTEPVHLVGNAAKVEVIDRLDFPDRFQLEVYSLRRRVEELQGIILDKNDRLSKAIAMLEDEALMWRTVMYDHVDETYGKIKRRMIRIDSTLATLKDIQPRHYPPLEIPDSWKSGKVK